jgi:endonuclease/exonuclease/phosphatase (EEP) superfamily protein YafD
MTYNVNFGLGGDPETLAVIAGARTDLVVLQETTPDWEQALRARLGAEYPYMAFRHCCRAGGLGVLSRYPFDEREYLVPKHGWFPAWRLVVHSAIGELQVLAVHLRPPVSDSGSVLSGYFSTPATREAEIEAHFPHLDRALPTLVAGDFNEGAGGRAVAFLERRGFRSVLPELGGAQDTWRWNTSIGTVRAQLDHLMYDHRLVALRAAVVPRGGSDHYPIIGVFEPATNPFGALAD